MQRRTAIAAIPLALAGFSAAARRAIATTTSTSYSKALTDRELRHSLALITHASTSGISCAFVAFAHHISTLANAGDYEAIRATAESLLDSLYDEHNQYDEPRATWLSEEVQDFADVVDMDDENASDEEIEAALKRSRDRHVRRGGEAYEC